MPKAPLLLLDCYTNPNGGLAHYAPWLVPADLAHVQAPYADVPLQAAYSGIVVTGSAASICAPEPWMMAVGDLIRDAARRDVPVLGCCFGHQVIAHAHFGEEAVERAPAPEVGYLPITMSGQDPVLDALPRNFHAFVTHEDQVVSIPSLQVLGRSEQCAVHALRVPGHRTWGVQFHVEYPLEEQTRILHYRSERHPELKLDPEQMLRHRADTTATAHALFGRFLEVCNWR
ncbi:MAG: hypothetical protein GWP91_19665 [Rhodobacterales bacterium]|nr:hypothetical protein [Rhodobacterales bacterium]